MAYWRVPHDLYENVEYHPVGTCKLVPLYKFDMVVSSRYIGDIPDPEKTSQELEGGENVSNLKGKLKTHQGHWKSIDGMAPQTEYQELIYPATVSINHTLVEELLKRM